MTNFGFNSAPWLLLWAQAAQGPPWRQDREAG